MVLSETKIYGIPSILLGLDYVSIAEGGTIIIYDDLPESLALKSLKIISSKKYRRKLGKEARNSMRHFSNELLIKKWIKLILSIYKGEHHYNKLREEYKKISQPIGMNILNNQLKLLKTRYVAFKGITMNKFENFSYMYNYLNE